MATRNAHPKAPPRLGMAKVDHTGFANLSPQEIANINRKKANKVSNVMRSLTGAPEKSKVDIIARNRKAAAATEEAAELPVPSAAQQGGARGKGKGTGSVLSSLLAEVDEDRAARKKKGTQSQQQQQPQQQPLQQSGAPLVRGGGAVALAAAERDFAAHEMQLQQQLQHQQQELDLLKALIQQQGAPQQQQFFPQPTFAVPLDSFAQQQQQQQQQQIFQSQQQQQPQVLQHQGGVDHLHRQTLEANGGAFSLARQRSIMAAAQPVEEGYFPFGRPGAGAPLVQRLAQYNAIGTSTGRQVSNQPVGVGLTTSDPASMQFQAAPQLSGIAQHQPILSRSSVAAAFPPQAPQEEFFPFGRPGAGAPPAQRAAQYNALAVSRVGALQATSQQMQPFQMHMQAPFQMPQAMPTGGMTMVVAGQDPNAAFYPYAGQPGIAQQVMQQTAVLRASQDDHFPFGRPGAGAPPAHRTAQYINSSQAFEPQYSTIQAPAAQQNHQHAVGTQIAGIAGVSADPRKEAQRLMAEELQRQVEEKKERKRLDKAREDEREAKKLAEMMAYNPWGRPGAGAAPPKRQDSSPSSLQNTGTFSLQTDQAPVPQMQQLQSQQQPTIATQQLQQQQQRKGSDAQALSSTANFISTAVGGQMTAQDIANVAKNGMLGLSAEDESSRKQKARQQQQDALKQQIEEREAARKREQKLKDDEEERDRMRILKEQEILKQKFEDEQRKIKEKEEAKQAALVASKKALDDAKIEGERLKQEARKRHHLDAPEPAQSSAASASSTAVNTTSEAKSTPQEPASGKAKVTALDTATASTTTAATTKGSKGPHPPSVAEKRSQVPISAREKQMRNRSAGGAAQKDRPAPSSAPALEVKRAPAPPPEPRASSASRKHQRQFSANSSKRPSADTGSAQPQPAPPQSPPLPAQRSRTGMQPQPRGEAERAQSPPLPAHQKKSSLGGRAQPRPLEEDMPPRARSPPLPAVAARRQKPAMQQKPQQRGTARDEPAPEVEEEEGRYSPPIPTFRSTSPPIPTMQRRAAPAPAPGPAPSVDEHEAASRPRVNAEKLGQINQQFVQSPLPDRGAPELDHQPQPPQRQRPVREMQRSDVDEAAAPVFDAPVSHSLLTQLSRLQSTLRERQLEVEDEIARGGELLHQRGQVYAAHEVARLHAHDTLRRPREE